MRAGRRGERGQAMPLAAVGVFAIVLAILATLNLGQAVHQKIKLQNTADSAAYTLAAMEARTFNYIAFLNRAQLAHYNTALAVQSYMSWVGYHLALFGTAVDVLTTLRDAYQVGLGWYCGPTGGPGCPYIAASAVSFAPLVAAVTAAQAARRSAQELYDRAEDIGHDIVEAMAIFNARAIWQSQFARAVLLNAHILTGMQSYIEKLDPEISFSKGKSALLNWLVNSALNSIEYYQAFDASAGLNPFIFSAVKDFPQLAANDFMIKRSTTGGAAGNLGGAAGTAAGAAAGAAGAASGVDEAYRVMTALCNASRSPSFVSRRSDFGLASKTVANVTLMGSKMGQSKLTEQGALVGASIPGIRSGLADAAVYAASDDYLLGAAGGGVALPATVTWTGTLPLGDAIAAYESRGEHHRYRGSRGTPSGVTVAFPPTTPPASGGGTERHAPWPGFAAYFKFKPQADRTADYNQPSTWIFLNKHHEDFQTAKGSHAQRTRAPWYSSFSWENGEQVAALDTTVGGKRNSYLFEGLNAMARGQVYYHRPGAWAEQPNFFNPYWRARLAPVGQKLQAFWDRWVSSKITTSADSAVVRAAVNVLRNAQMDLLTAAVTSVVTH